MHKTTLYLDDETRARLQALARATRRSQAEIIRSALASYAPPRERPTSLGLGDSGLGDLADRANDYLTGFGEDP